jgi:hypothetical protein
VYQGVKALDGGKLREKLETASGAYLQVTA